MISQVFEKTSFIKVNAAELSNFAVQLSEKSNCVVQGIDASEYWHCGTMHIKNGGGPR